MSAPNLRCSVEWCLQPASPGMVLFDMPMETDIREKWVELLGTLPSTARKFFVCSGHFPDEEFISGSLFRKLKSNATPSRNFFVRPLDINTNSSAPVKVEPDEELTAENSICRACMSECNEHYKSLLKPEILSLFESSTGVLLTKSRRLPNVICDECFETMSNWQGFKKMCIKSNDVFTKRLEEESSTSGFIDISTSSSNRKRSTSIVADNSSNKRQKINRQAPTSEDISSDRDNYSATDDDDNTMDPQPSTSNAAPACKNDPSSYKMNTTELSFNDHFGAPSEVSETSVDQNDFYFDDDEYTFKNKESFRMFLKKHCGLILKNYKLFNKLDNQERNTISKLTIKHIMGVSLHPKQIKRDQFHQLAYLIVEIFPTEIASTYFTKAHKKMPAGKLYNAYTNLRTTLSAKGRLQRKQRATPVKTKKNILKDCDPISLSEFENFTTIVNVSQIQGLWQESFHKREMLLRNVKISDYINTFVALKESNGFELLFTDFELKMNKASLVDFAPHFLSAILLHGSFIPSRQAIWKIINNQVECEVDYNSKAIIALQCLQFCFNKIQPKSFIIHYDNQADADIDEKLLQEEALEKRRPINHPRLAIIGSPVELCYVYINQLTYTFTDLKKAFELCFAAFHALGIEYPSTCKNVWLFIEKFVFKVQNELEYSVVNTLGNDLRLFGTINYEQN